MILTAYQTVRSLRMRLRVLYAEKKRATSVLRTIGFHMPIELTKSGFISSISYTGKSVNIFGEKFSNIFSESKTQYCDRDADSVSNRSLLANALESVAQNDIERNKLEQYKQKIELTCVVGYGMR